MRGGREAVWGGKRLFTAAAGSYRVSVSQKWEASGAKMPPGSAAPLGRRAEEKPGPPSSPLPAIPPRSTIPRSQAPPGREAAPGSPQSRRRRPRAPLRGLGAPRVWRLRVSAGVRRRCFLSLQTLCPGLGSCLGFVGFFWGFFFGCFFFSGRGGEGTPTNPKQTETCFFFVVSSLPCPGRGAWPAVAAAGREGEGARWVLALRTSL